MEVCLRKVPCKVAVKETTVLTYCLQRMTTSSESKSLFLMVSLQKHSTPSNPGRSRLIPQFTSVAYRAI
jgi:hypothetical protein